MLVIPSAALPPVSALGRLCLAAAVASSPIGAAAAAGAGGRPYAWHVPRRRASGGGARCRLLAVVRTCEDRGLATSPADAVRTDSACLARGDGVCPACLCQLVSRGSTALTTSPTPPSSLSQQRFRLARQLRSPCSVQRAACFQRVQGDVCTVGRLRKDTDKRSCRCGALHGQTCAFQ